MKKSQNVPERSFANVIVPKKKKKEEQTLKVRITSHFTHISQVQLIRHAYGKRECKSRATHTHTDSPVVREESKFSSR